MTGNTGLYILSGLLVLLIVLIVILIIKFSSFKDKLNTKDIKDEIDRGNNNMISQNVNFNDKINKSFQEFIIAMNKNIESINKQLGTSVKDGFQDTNKTIDDFKQKMAVIEKSQENINNLTNQIITLEKILGNNKTVGNFGEALLEQVLTAYFGSDDKLFKTQYSYKEKGIDVKPDAVIFMPNEMIFIDSKFPLKFYQDYLEAEDPKIQEECIAGLKTSFKSQVKEVYEKYIIEDVTSDFACMFIPSDSLLAFLYKNCADVIEIGKKNKVVFLSPSTMVPFISSLKSVKLDYERNTNAKVLYEGLVSLSGEFKRFADRWVAETTEINRLYQAHKELETTSEKITKKFEAIKNMNFEDKE